MYYRLGVCTGKLYNEYVKTNEIKECCIVLNDSSVDLTPTKIKELYDKHHKRCEGCTSCESSLKVNKFNEEFKEIEKLQPYPLESFFDRDILELISLFLPSAKYSDIFSLFKGYKVLIDGDIESIKTYGITKDKTNIYKITIIYNIDDKVTSLTQLPKRVSVVTSNEDLIEKTKDLRPYTRVKLVASFEGHIDHYRLEEVLETSNTLKFGYFTCEECDYSYINRKPKISKRPRKHICPKCQKDLVYIDQFYK